MTLPLTPPRVRILLDNDTGIDDALALAYLAACPHVEIVAVTATPGNVDADQVAANNRALLALCGQPQVPVLIGAREPLRVPLVTTPETHGPQGVGYATLPDPGPADPQTGERDAVDYWIEAARANPGELTALLTAPLTNFAHALRREPRLPWLLRRVVIMGGAFYYQGNTTPTAEWNTHVDPHAAAEVYAAYTAAAEAGLDEEKLPIVCSLDTTERFEMQPALLTDLAAAAGCAEPEHVLAGDPEGQRSTASNPLVRYLSDALRFYFEFHRHYDQGYIAHVHDFFAAGIAAGTLEHRNRPATVAVETESPLLFGTTVADFRSLWGKPANARVVSWNDPETGFAELVERLGVLARRLEPAD
ncbi:nucleoside hydrolase [Paeniglutamicibacter kerguelensis]|uniref:Inosine-uridine nucleoside N-ribohydrolase n=1 Tax=Paeniglutamicibacter kerguelensis TaxID=254788 RepID=A0ABS4XDL8_9MICC|nr:nucleoside hydrolase [Paeniglutamicibacter kerguelensis]MBP2386569.1 inosine-uridine nucleoside N-ribohydrolase [Paeniglutamicibacter kerguelensis]